jgi:hypothetical protein
MAVLTGTKGLITFSGGYVTKISNWTVTIQADSFDNSAIGDTWTTNITGVHSWSGTYTGGLDSDGITGVSGSSDATLNEFQIGAAAAAAVFGFDDGASSDGAITGNIIVTGIDLSCEVDSRNEITFTWVGDGAVTTTRTG